MDLIGEIVREPDPPGIDNQRWIDLIREHPNLAPPEPREGISPFTKRSMVKNSFGLSLKWLERPLPI